MGESDPRRSSRARANPSQLQSSSNASSCSGRGERASRSSTNKTSSSQLSTPGASTASTSSEPPDDSVTLHTDTLARTLRSRAKEADRNRPVLKEERDNMGSSDNDIQDDDESVRCICGFDDYPGPPISAEGAKHGSKDSIDLDLYLIADVPDDVAGFFLQCDICKVWQHGGCVGILTAASSPDEYFCEQCRKDLHKISTASSGQRYSHYLPVSRNSRSASRTTASAGKDRAKSPKDRERERERERESRNTKPSQVTAQSTSKRRSTMNSRGVYDEEEELRRAIEASKEDAPPDSVEAAPRRTKRGRSDSEEKLDTKRQRTGSRSPSPQDDIAIQDDSDDIPMRNGPSKKSRTAAAARTQREKAEKEERDKQRAEAASKRKGRAERRRAEDSDPSEEIPLAARATARTQAAAAEMQPPPPKQSPPQRPVEKSQASSKSKKSASRKKGRNQYTKDRDDRSGKRSQSRDVPDQGGRGDSSRSRNSRNHHAKEKDKDLSWLDMERRIAYWTDFTQRVELDLNLDRGGSGSSEQKADQEKSEPKRLSPVGNATSSSSSSLLAPPPNVPANGGSPLKNVLGVASDHPPDPTATAESPTVGERVVQNEADMNIQERLEFIKAKIKTWHSDFGMESRGGAS